MLVERSLKDALRDYLKGKKVLVVNEFDDGSMEVQSLENMLPQDDFHYLVDVPAVENPDFQEAVRDMVAGASSTKNEPDKAPEEETAAPPRNAGGK